MHNNATTLYRFFLAAGDILALLLSFTAAYVLRVSLSGRPIAVNVSSFEFISFVIALLPLWIVLFYMLGLYSRHVYEYKPRELSRLLVAAILGIMLMITFSFFTSIPLFPAKLVALYALGISYVLLVVIRSLIRVIRLITLDRGIGLSRLLVIGDNEATSSLLAFISSNPRSGYCIVGVVADDKFVPPLLKKKQFGSLDEALLSSKPDVIMQTDTRSSNRIYNLAVDNHIAYQYVPSHEALMNTRHTTEIIGTLPVIIVQTTPLIGYGRILKRIVDIIVSTIALILTSPIWVITALIMKLLEPTTPVIYRQERLSRHNKPVYIYKFCTLKRQYNGLTPEGAFEKMGKSELAKKYRDNGDWLDKDPRVTPFGRFLRSTSIDELPQLLNVLKGDISLVGPRALVPEELKRYQHKHLILSVKSGLTGLAQISGRRDISFDDRRALDIYYVHNWSLWLDTQIIVKTIWHVIFRKGAM